ncbi:MAG: DUF4843 domain-containing protein [Odoribacteraceae bacterium]|jgi:hypothetical protein|nr:DUF4843 domain-containing protein [Odoribacteraceae bacterium]
MKLKIAICGLLLPALFFLAGACEELVVNKYQDDPSLYFYRGTFDDFGNGQFDSLVYSFYLKENTRTRDTLWVEVRLSGLPSPDARPVPVKQLATDTLDAEPGTHYLPFDDPEVTSLFVLPANAVKAKLPIVVLRDTTLKVAERTLLLELGTNSHFSPGIEGQTRFLVRFSDLTAQPSNWNTMWKNVFGTWGPVKMRFIIDHVGFSNFDLKEILGDMRDYLQTKARQKLAEYNAKNEPLKELDGTRVRF